jgi:hypothetical protein
LDTLPQIISNFEERLFLYGCALCFYITPLIAASTPPDSASKPSVRAGTVRGRFGGSIDTR